MITRWLKPGWTCARSCACLLALLVAWGPCMRGQVVAQEHITATATLLPSGDELEIEYRADGETWKDVLPVYRSGDVRYFSAGVGLAERHAEYPAFPLKIVLTAGGKAFAARADVHIVQTNGDTTLSIPADQVTGPWLFVDLPAGEYTITGNRGGATQQQTRVRVEIGAVRTVHLRFPGD